MNSSFYSSLFVLLLCFISSSHFSDGNPVKTHQQPEPIQKQSPNLPVFHVLVTGFGPFRDYTDNPSGDIAVALNDTCIQFDDLLVDERSGGPQQDSFIVCFEGWLLPVNETGATAVANHLLNQPSGPAFSDWAAILHLGLENSSLGLKLETIGANILADNSSKQAVPGAPGILPTTGDLSLLSIPELLYLPWSTDLVWIDGEPVMEQILGSISDTCTGKINCGRRKALIEKAMRKTTLTRQEEQEIGEELWSRDAGTYFCNETFFRTLNVVRSSETQVSADACTFTSSGKISSRRKRGQKQSAESCWSSPRPGMVPVEFVHVPDASNVELETAIQLVARISAFLVLPTSLTL